MAAQSVALYLRIKTSNGWSFAKAAFTKQNLPRPLYAVVNGTHEHHPEGVYHLRFQNKGKRTWQPIGKDASLGLVALQNKAKEIETGKPVTSTQIVAESQPAIGPKPGDEAEHQESGKAQHTAPEPEASTHPKAERKLLSTAIDEYLEEKRLAGKKKKTLSAYTTALRYFQESFLKKYLDEVERVDMLKFHAFLRDDKEQLPRTCWNKFSNVMGFLKEQGIRGIVRKQDWPVYQEDEPEIYEREELNAFFSACTDEERLWFEFFLQTGMREQEVIYCRPENVNHKHGTVSVRRNDQFGWTAKAYKGREIPISLWLNQKLAARKLPPNAKLLFATRTGEPKLDFLDCCKAIAQRAGLDPENFWLHKFRATMATIHLQAGVDFRTVQKWLGHVDSASTLRYLRPARGEEVQRKVNHTWSVIAPGSGCSTSSASSSG